MEALCDGQGRALHVKRVAEICGRRWGGERGKVDWGTRRPPDTLRDVRSSACCHTWRGARRPGDPDTTQGDYGLSTQRDHITPCSFSVSHFLLPSLTLSFPFGTFPWRDSAVFFPLSLPCHLRTFHTHFLISVFGNHGNNKNMSSRHFSCSVLCFIYFSQVFHQYQFIWDSWNIRRLFNSPGILLIFPHFYFLFSVD